MYRNIVKRRIAFIQLLLFAVLQMAAVEYEPYKGSRILWDTSTRQTIFPTGWYARMIQLQDGRLMAVCEHGGIEVRYNEGRGVWSDGVLIAKGHDNIGMRTPDLVQLTDGTIVVAYNPRPEEPYTEDRKFGIRVKRSTDNGKTWGPEIFVYDAQHLFTDGCWEPSLLELPSGELQLYFSNEGIYTNSNEQNISVCRSFDGGLSWSEPEFVCFRQDYRDGMPCPIILKDQSEIVVTIEDNGWPGVGDFFPTTVRCPLSVNWHDYYVDKDSPNRAKTLDFSFCPNATGGAPYLRMLPWGETVMSYQSAYGRDGRLSMYVALGDEQARGFKSLQHPFYTDSQQTVMWNSLCVVDTGQVVAIGGVGNSIEMIKGYAVSKLQAPYAHPIIDGKQTRNEGYYQPLATQILTGINNGVRTAGDVAYDCDTLYVFVRISDRTPKAAASNSADAANIFLDTGNRCGRAPLTDMHWISLRRDGSVMLAHGDDAKKKWTVDKEHQIRSVVVDKTSYYIVEAAIPWADLDVTESVEGSTMRLNLELQDNQNNGTTVTEGIVDAVRNQSWTWMELYMQPNPDPTDISSHHISPDAATLGNMSESKSSRPVDLQGRPLSSVTHQGVIVVNGKKILNRQ